MEEVSIIGLDLAKRSFQAHGARADGGVGFRKKLSREKVLAFLSEHSEAAGPQKVKFPSAFAFASRDCGRCFDAKPAKGA
jgi:transposase